MYTNVFNISLSPDLVKEVETWAKGIGISRNEAFDKLLRLGLGRANVKLGPSMAKPAVKRRARQAEAEGSSARPIERKHFRESGNERRRRRGRRPRRPGGLSRVGTPSPRKTGRSRPSWSASWPIG
jgi:hypothetical protein